MSGTPVTKFKTPIRRFLLLHHGNVGHVATSGFDSSAIASYENVHQFRDLTALLLLVAARYCMLDAMGNVVAQNFLFNFAQSGTDSGNLRHDVDAVPILFKHFGKPTHLAFNAAKALKS